MYELNPKKLKPSSVDYTTNQESEKNTSSKSNELIQLKNSGIGLFSAAPFIQPNAVLRESNEENENSIVKNVGTETGPKHSSSIQAKSTDNNVQLTGKERRELTPEELLIKDEFGEYVKIVRDKLFPSYTEKEQSKFNNDVE